MKRSFGLIILAVAIAAALAYGFRPTPILIEATQVSRGPLRVTVEEEGKARVIDRFVLSAPVAGFSRRIELEVGDVVGQGQVMALLEPLRSNVLDPRARAEAQARVAAAQASLLAAEQNTQAAKADADVASANLARIRLLYEANNVSREAMDEAKARSQMTGASLRSAEFNVEVARHQLEGARTALRYSAAQGTTNTDEIVQIKAPVDGSVLRIQHKSEGVVNAGEALLEIGNPRSLEVEVDVLSADAVRIASGTPVLFERWGGDEALEGEVRTVEPVGFTKISALGVEEQRVLVIADITSPRERWERLGDGYRLEAKFILWEGDDVLQVPASALFRHDGNWALFAVEDEKALRREVELGHRGSFTVEIKTGVNENKVVVLHPDDSIEDGSRVRIR
ncbi:MAG: HlyD family efflux transporter periplasmic adaptor subunit [Gammaproteobacteria bacterium]|nr:HlyD family efflux transporter periplasmic adaptor subunit [Gammaproteobacteria bacterium]